MTLAWLVITLIPPGGILNMSCNWLSAHHADHTMRGTGHVLLLDGLIILLIQLYGSWTSAATSGLVIMLIPPVEVLGMSCYWLVWSTCSSYQERYRTGLAT